jgi:peptide/nickel transport system substrate-binding protein
VTPRERIDPIVLNAHNDLRAGTISRRHFLRLATLLGVSASTANVLAACATPPPQPAEAPAAVPTSAPAPAEARIIFGYGAEAVNLDVAQAIDGPSFDVIYSIHEGLLETAENGEIMPALAEAWTLSDDELTWTFKLRQGVKFQDGTDFDAAAVKFNFDRVLNPDLGLANLGQWESHIAAVNVVDSHTVEITT